MRKLAIIRNNQDTICPFGLSITKDCLIAGNSVDKMEVIQDVDVDNSQLIGRNLQILAVNSEPQRCKYAAHLFKNKSSKVDCDYGDTAAGMSQEVAFVGSPYYGQVGEGVGLAGGTAFPIIYQDGQEYTTLYYGTSRWASPRTIKSILRQSLLQILKSPKTNNIV